MEQEVYDCLLCGTTLHCQISWSMLIEKFPPVICEKCEGKFEHSIRAEKGHTSLFQYNEAMKDFLHRYKFMQDVVLAKVFRMHIHQLLKNQRGIIVPIPMHPDKRIARTFAQVDELLKEAHIPFIHLLEKNTPDSQSKKNRAERISVAPLFSVKGTVEKKSYILFDDIYTTGTTIQHATNALLEAGAASVTASTLIRG